MSGALLFAIRQFVLAGLPTTSTLMSDAACSLSALPWGLKMPPLASSRSLRSIPLLRGRAPTSTATLAPSNALLGSSLTSMSEQQRERAVDQLHRGALDRLQRGGDLEQRQLDRRVGTEQLAAGDAEQDRVADLAGGAGDGDYFGGVSHLFISVG